MKFIVESITKEGCRFGRIKEIGCHANLTVETPACLMYTRAGAVPHLTWDLVEKTNHCPQNVQLTCATLVDQHELLTQFGKGMAQFASLPERAIIYVSIQDPAHPAPTGYNDKHSVSVFTSAGRTKLDLNQFISLQEALQPDWFEALCDGDTPPGCSMKRTKKAVDRTLELLDQCLEAKQKSQNLHNADILGVIEGGQMSDERQRSARETALRPVAGFVLDALGYPQMDSSTRFKLVETVLKELPESKPRLLPGAHKPDDILQALEMGIDVFDSSYPYEVTQRGCALVFPFDATLKANSSSVTESTDSSHPEQSSNEDDSSTKSGDIDPRFELDLSEKRFAEDFSPVVSGCECYCCKSHTKAYINHLLNVNELLARVLLMNHNCQHYFKFFHSIRESLKQGVFQQLKETVTSQR